jgi:hypothetical protein
MPIDSGRGADREARSLLARLKFLTEDFAWRPTRLSAAIGCTRPLLLPALGFDAAPDALAAGALRPLLMTTPPARALAELILSGRVRHRVHTVR